MPDITRDVNPKGPRTASDLEDKMEKILLPLAVATEAAFDALKLRVSPDELSPAVAEIVADAVSDSYGTAYDKLIELARVTVGDDTPIRPSGPGAR